MKLTFKFDLKRGVTTDELEDAIQEAPKLAKLAASMHAGKMTQEFKHILLTIEQDSLEVFELLCPELIEERRAEEFGEACDTFFAGDPCEKCRDVDVCEKGSCREKIDFEAAKYVMKKEHVFCDKEVCPELAKGACPYKQKSRCPKYEFTSSSRTLADAAAQLRAKRQKVSQNG